MNEDLRQARDVVVIADDTFDSAAVLAVLRSDGRYAISRVASASRTPGPPAAVVVALRGHRGSVEADAIRTRFPDVAVITTDPAAVPTVGDGAALTRAAASAAELLDSLEQATGGGAGEASASRQRVSTGAEPEALASLTEREAQVLALLAEDVPADRIASMLDISHNTVRTHVRNAMTKLGVRSRREAAALGRRQRQPAPREELLYEEPSILAAPPRRIVVAAPAGMRRDGLEQLIAAEVGLDVAAVCDASDVLGVVTRLRPHAVVCDASVIRSNRAAVEALVNSDPATNLIILGARGDAHELEDAVLLGAKGYFVPSSSGRAAVDAVHRVAAGGAYLPSDLLSGLLDRVRQRRRQEDDAIRRFLRLSAREQAVLRMIAAGESEQSIADAMYVSFHTTRTHLQNVLKKLGVHSRAEAVELLTQFDLLERFPQEEGEL